MGAYAWGKRCLVEFPLYLLVCIQRWGRKKNATHLLQSYGYCPFSSMIYDDIPSKMAIFPALACPDQVAVFDMHEDVCARSNVLEAAQCDPSEGIPH